MTKNNLDPKKRIMVVEDENIVAMDIEQGLKRLGYEIPLVLSSGEEAIANAGKVMPDLILMDIQLKDKIDGIEAARQIQEKYSIPIIFLTAYADEATLFRAKQAEPYGYLLKPFEESELHTAIEIVLQKHKRVSETEASFVKELVLSEERFRIFVNSVYDYAIFMLDIGGNVVSWNAGAKRILGYSAEDVIGKSIDIFLPENNNNNSLDKQEILEKIFATARENGQYLKEGWQIKKDGTKFWAHSTLSALYDKRGILIGYGEVVHDMTNSKITEDILRKAVKGRDEFISIASHELKTPLTSLLLQTQAFKRSRQNQDDSIYAKTNVNRIIEHTFKQTVRLSRLVEDMLDISRIRTGKFTMDFKNFDLIELVDEVVEKLAPQFMASKIPTPILTAPETLQVCWDRERIEQVITNLLINACRYAPGKPVKINVEDKNKDVQILIEDQGIGIADKDQQKIFERFGRAVEADKISGMGLGLYITKEIIDSHHGRIWVESELGKGAKFYFVLEKNISNRKEKAAVSPILSQK